MEFSDQQVTDLAKFAHPHSWYDGYKKEVVIRRPLSFDRVNEGRPSQSSSPLFRLPVEMIGEILRHIPQASLSSLALVSRDCRQLARSRQFASVLLDYSYHSLDLVDLLYKEQEERLRNNGSTLLPSLGSCIRAITVATDSRNLSLNHGIMKRDLSGLKENVDLEDVWDLYYRQYIQTLRMLLFDLTVLPHLEVFDWNDTLTLDRFYFDIISCLSIQHLKLHNVSIDEELIVNEFKILDSCTWPLKSLHLNIGTSSALPDKIRTFPLCRSILQRCASTLESLTWESELTRIDCDPEWPEPNDPESRWPYDLTLPCIPKLRKLKLHRVKALCEDDLGAIIQEGLRALEIDLCLTPYFTGFFRERGTIGSLETLVVKFRKYKTWNSRNDFLHFLGENVHISKLRLEETSERFIGGHLLPLLSSSFFHLTSLSLAWPCRFLSEQKLSLLGFLTSLEQIHLTTMEKYIHIDEWRINHERMRKHLCKLIRLKKLVFSDRYKTCTKNPIWYYPSRRPIKDCPSDQRSRYEKEHCEHMLGEARNYATAMSTLEWIYIGKLPIGVEELPDKKGRNVVSLSGGKDEDYRDRLEDMFGWKPFFPR